MFGIDAQRIAAFAKSPLDNPLSRSEQMELARLFLHIQKQADIFNNMPNQPILDGHIQMVINSHEKGWAAIVPCTITYKVGERGSRVSKSQCRIGVYQSRNKHSYSHGVHMDRWSLLASTSPHFIRQLDATNPSA